MGSVGALAQHDTYSLTPSPVFSLQDGQEVRQDLTLRPAPPLGTGVVFGRLSPRSARARAVVQLLTGDGEPVAHVQPDGQTGFYLFHPLRPGRYRLAAASPGFETFLGGCFRVRPGGVARQDIELMRETNADRATFGGHVLTAGHLPVAGAGVALVPAGGRAPDRTYVTTSIADGEYLLCGVRPGDYLLLSWKPGFTPHQERLRLRRAERVQRDVVLRPRA